MVWYLSAVLCIACSNAAFSTSTRPPILPTIVTIPHKPLPIPAIPQLPEKTTFTEHQSHDDRHTNVRKQITSCINIAAFIYASYQVYDYYQELYGNQQPSWFASLWPYKRPSRIMQLHKDQKLLWHTFCVMCEVVIYKTIAQCVVACATQEFIDHITLLGRKVKKIIF